MKVEATETQKEEEENEQSDLCSHDLKLSIDRSVPLAHSKNLMRSRMFPLRFQVKDASTG